MQTSEFLEIASLIAAHGRNWIASTDPPAAEGLEEYWVASRCRLDRWGLALRRANDGPVIPWPTLSPLLEQVLASEMVTRAWAAVLCGHDKRHRRRESDPVGRSVLIGHLEARHRVLQMLVHGRGLELEMAQSLSVLCRRTECWTDLVIGSLCAEEDVANLAFSDQRARRYSGELSALRPRRGRSPWGLLGLSLRASFVRWLQQPEPNTDLNARVAGGILGSIPRAEFDDLGVARSLWYSKLARAIDDTVLAVGKLADAPPPHSPRRF